MERSDNTAVAETSAPKNQDEAAEIDRIMKEIEDLEKKMDSPDTEIKEISQAPEPAKVVPMRPVATESMAETDAVPVVDAPLVQDPGTYSSGNLSLKIGGCTDITLEFTRSSTTVYLTYGDEGLKITTDQGAEFRIPFKQAA